MTEPVIKDKDYILTFRPSVFKEWNHLSSSGFGVASDGTPFSMQNITNAGRLMAFYFSENGQNADFNFRQLGYQHRLRSMKGLSSYDDQEGKVDSQLTGSTLALLTPSSMYFIENDLYDIKNLLTRYDGERLQRLENNLQETLISVDEGEVFYGENGKIRKISRDNFSADQKSGLEVIFNGKENAEFISDFFKNIEFDVREVTERTMVTIGLSVQDKKFKVSMKDSGSFGFYFAFGEKPSK